MIHPIHPHRVGSSSSEDQGSTRLGSGDAMFLEHLLHHSPEEIEVGKPNDFHPFDVAHQPPGIDAADIEAPIVDAPPLLPDSDPEKSLQ